MSLNLHRLTIPSLAVIAICVTAVIAGWSLDTKLQSKSKTLAKSRTRNTVVELEQITIANKEIKDKEAFSGGDDWLETLQFRVRNVSTKPITYLELNINFPETRSETSAMSSYVLRFGHKTPNQSLQKNLPLYIPVAATFDIRCSETYSSIKQFVEARKAMKNITQAELEVGWVMFEDKTAWAAGNFYKPDPTNPNRYINVGDTPSH